MTTHDFIPATVESPHDTAFYDQLTTRNRGFIAEGTQADLRRATILVAGCGSTGGAAVEPLVRLGAERFLLAEPGTYELNNLNRQNAFLDEIGLNKAEVCRRRVLGVNPAALAEVHAEGITGRNVRGLVSRARVVIDGVDVTEMAGWRAKYQLHEAAAALGIPVITGWDMAGTQYVRFYDYQPGDEPFDGAIRRDDLERASTWELMRAAVPLRFVPVEMLEQARRQVAGASDDGLPQLVHASLLFGALAARMTLNVIEGRPVRRHTVIDTDKEVGTRRSNVRRSLRKPVVVALALRDLARLGRHGAS